MSEHKKTHSTSSKSKQEQTTKNKTVQKPTTTQPDYILPQQPVPPYPYSQYPQYSQPFIQQQQPYMPNPYRPRNPNISEEQLYEQIQVTLVELNKAIENVKVMYHTAQRIGLFDLFNSDKGSSNLSSMMKLLKSVDFQQLYAIAQSPFIQQMLNDPNFYQLFAPDTGTTPGTSLEEAKKLLADNQNNTRN